MRIGIFLFGMFSYLCSLVFSATIHVPVDYATIQAAIDAAASGDTVLVDSGTYVENIDFLGKAIIVKSQAGAPDTVIDGGQAGSVATFDDGEGPDSVLEGFTLFNGTGTPVEFNPGKWYNCGGGICCIDFVSPTIEQNIITGNVAYCGGGICCRHGCSPVISGNTVSKNDITNSGGGIYCTWESSPMIEDNIVTENNDVGIWSGSNSVISGNTVSKHTWGIIASDNAVVIKNSVSGFNIGGIYCSGDCDPVIMNNSISNGGMYGIECRSDVSPEIVNNTITGASSGILCSDTGYVKIMNNIIADNAHYGVNCEGGSLKLINNTITGNGYYGVFSSTSTVNLLNTIVWDNKVEIDFKYPPVPEATYCDVKGGYPGTGNINADPLFESGSGGDYYLSHTSTGHGSDSPCVDAGISPSSNFGMHVCWTRIDGVPDTDTVDMGFHYGPFIIPSLTLMLDDHRISASAGGTLYLHLDAGASNGGRNYLILGGVSGTSPGFFLPGGLVTMPVNWDSFTGVALSMLNTTIFTNFMGTLYSYGTERADLNMPPLPASAVGLRMYYAFCCDKPFDFVSNPLVVEVVP